MKSNLDEEDKVLLLIFFHNIEDVTALIKKQTSDKAIKDYAKAIELGIKAIQQVLEVKVNDK